MISKLKVALCKLPKSMIYLLGYLGLILVFSLSYYMFPSMLKIGGDSFVESLYFSIVTMTTLGFGDVLPITNVGRIIVSIQALSGVMLLGFFLNSLAHSNAIKIVDNENKIVANENENLRKSLAQHACLIIHVFKSGNPFAWDMHVKHAAPIEELESFCRETYASISSRNSKISVLQIKALLEVCDQNYETFVALSSAASKLPGDFLLNWISLTSNIRFISQEYKKVIVAKSDEGGYIWPEISNIAIQIQELIETTLNICGRDPISV